MSAAVEKNRPRLVRHLLEQDRGIRGIRQLGDQRHCRFFTTPYGHAAPVVAPKMGAQ
jgi:hypothetical protein